MQRLYALLDVIAPSPLNVLILGETGTGKEVFAEAIHKGSPRAHAPFLSVNCAALSGSLLESELFGHEKGAFTGALGAKAGLFEAADGGTVFLDEVGELPLETQAKLLRVLEYGEVIRLGSVQPRRVDVRFVAATNRDLQRGDRARAASAPISSSASTASRSRCRRSASGAKDIVPLARHFLDRAAQRPAVHASPPTSQAALERVPVAGQRARAEERRRARARPRRAERRASSRCTCSSRVRAQTGRTSSHGAHEVIGPNDTIPPTPYGDPRTRGARGSVGRRTTPSPGVPIAAPADAARRSGSGAGAPRTRTISARSASRGRSSRSSGARADERQSEGGREAPRHLAPHAHQQDRSVRHRAAAQARRALEALLLEALDQRLGRRRLHRALVLVRSAPRRCSS